MTKFKMNNQAHLIHGGEGAVQRIRKGKPFEGLAANTQREVEEKLETCGIGGMVKDNAIRLQVALDLYWGAVQNAAQNGDLIALDRYTARFGWLSGVTLRAWAQVAQDERKGGNNVILDNVIRIYKQGEENDRENK